MVPTLAPCSLGTGHCAYRGQRVLAVAIKHKALPIESYDVAFTVEDTGGRALGTKLAGPLPLGASAGEIEGEGW